MKLQVVLLAGKCSIFFTGPGGCRYWNRQKSNLSRRVNQDNFQVNRLVLWHILTFLKLILSNLLREMDLFEIAFWTFFYGPSNRGKNSRTVVMFFVNGLMGWCHAPHRACMDLIIAGVTQSVTSIIRRRASNENSKIIKDRMTNRVGEKSQGVWRAVDRPAPQQ